jgi:predicted lactoylglutathione lyase
VRAHRRAQLRDPRARQHRALSAHETEEVDELMEENAELGGVMLGEEALSEATEAGAR